MNPAERPLSGIVIADFTHVFAGPWATQAMADAGATVIKIEPPGGEFTRNQGPFRDGDDGRQVRAWATALNAGKHSVALDLKDAEQRDLAVRVIRAADVVIENFRPGTLQSLGIDLASLREERPELVTCSISLRGDEGSSSPVRAGLSIVAEAEGGVMGTQLDADARPIPFGFALADIATGMCAYGAVLTALTGRVRGARGRHLDISMVSSVLTMVGSSVAAAQMTERPGAQSGMPAAMGVFSAGDGYVTIGVNSDVMFGRLCRAAGLEWMLDDSRYSLAAERDARAGEVNAVVEAWARTVGVAAVVDDLTRAKVPCGRVTTASDVLDDSVGLTAFLREVDDGAGGLVRVPVNPFGYDAGNRAVSHPTPWSRDVVALLGEADEGAA